MRRPVRRTLGVLAGSLVSLVLFAGPALAQISLDPTESPAKDTGGWVYWMAEGAIVLGVVILVVAGAAYLRYAPRFQRDEEDVAPRSGVRAPEPAVALQTSWQQASPPVAVQAVPPPQPVAVAAPVPAAPPAAAAAPAPAATGSAPAAPAAGAATAAPVAPRPKPDHVEPDPETYERVLAEELGKGTDRRVAEGRARSAGVRAARTKAAG
jgi:hypothetical protein